MMHQGQHYSPQAPHRSNGVDSPSRTTPNNGNGMLNTNNSQFGGLELTDHNQKYIHELESEREEMQQQIKKLLIELEQYRKLSKDSSAPLPSNHQLLLTALLEKEKYIEEQDRRHQDDIKAYQDKVEILQHDTISPQGEGVSMVKSLTTMNRTLRTRVAELERELNKITQSRSEIETTLIRQNSQLMEMDQLRIDKDKLDQKLSDCQLLVEDLQNKMADKSSKLREEQRARQELFNINQTMNNQMLLNNDEKQQLIAELEKKLSDEISTNNQLMKELEEERSKDREEIQSSTHDISITHDIDQRISELEEELQRAREKFDEDLQRAREEFDEQLQRDRDEYEENYLNETIKSSMFEQQVEDLKVMLEEKEREIPEISVESTDNEQVSSLQQQLDIVNQEKEDLLRSLDQMKEMAREEKFRLNEEKKMCEEKSRRMSEEMNEIKSNEESLRREIDRLNQVGQLQRAENERETEMLKRQLEQRREEETKETLDDGEREVVPNDKLRNLRTEREHKMNHLSRSMKEITIHLNNINSPKMTESTGNFSIPTYEDFTELIQQSISTLRELALHEDVEISSKIREDIATAEKNRRTLMKELDGLISSTSNISPQNTELVEENRRLSLEIKQYETLKDKLLREGTNYKEQSERNAAQILRMTHELEERDVQIQEIQREMSDLQLAADRSTTRQESQDGSEGEFDVESLKREVEELTLKNEELIEQFVKATQEAGSLEEDIERLMNERDDLQRDKDQLLQERAQSDGVSRENSEDLQLANERDREEFLREKERLEEERDQLSRQLEQVTNDHRNLRENYDKEREEAEEKIRSLTRELEASRKEMDKRQVEREETERKMEEELQHLREVTANSERGVEVEENLERSAELEDLQRQYDDLQRQYDDLQRQYDDLQRDHDDLQRDHDDLQRSKEELSGELRELASDREATLHDVKRKTEEYKEEREKTEEEKRKLSADIEVLSRHLEEISRQRDAAVVDRDAAIDLNNYLTQEKQGNLDEIHRLKEEISEKEATPVDAENSKILNQVVEEQIENTYALESIVDRLTSGKEEVMPEMTERQTAIYLSLIEVHEELSRQVEDLTRQIEEERCKSSDLNSFIHKIQSEYQSQTEDLDSLRRQNQAMRQELNNRKNVFDDQDKRSSDILSLRQQMDSERQFWENQVEQLKKEETILKKELEEAKKPSFPHAPSHSLPLGSPRTAVHSSIRAENERMRSEIIRLHKVVEDFAISSPHRQSERNAAFVDQMNHLRRENEELSQRVEHLQSRDVLTFEESESILHENETLRDRLMHVHSVAVDLNGTFDGTREDGGIEEEDVSKMENLREGLTSLMGLSELTEASEVVENGGQSTSETQKEITIRQILEMQRQSAQLDEVISQERREWQEHQKKLESDLESARAKLENVQRTYEQQLIDITLEFSRKMEEQKSASQITLDDLLRSLHDSEEKVKETKGLYQQHTRESQETISQLEDSCRRADEKIEDLTRQLQTVEEEKDKIHAEREELATLNQQFSRQIEEERASHDHVKRENERSIDIQSQLNHRIARLQEEVDKEKRETEAAHHLMRRQLDEEGKKLRGVEIELSLVQKQLEETKRESITRVDEVNRSLHIQTTLTTEIHTLRQTIEKMKATNTSVERHNREEKKSLELRAEEVMRTSVKRVEEERKTHELIVDTLNKRLHQMERAMDDEKSSHELTLESLNRRMQTTERHFEEERKSYVYNIDSLKRKILQIEQLLEEERKSWHSKEQSLNRRITIAERRMMDDRKRSEEDTLKFLVAVNRGLTEGRAANAKIIERLRKE
ncbi:hypothetical protein PROFUN_03756 [Planoprotostelium fungivorum]|uniref:Uncharacterized protein n=1 Tax=Planoprotostelium fungivorum TaxID=1890364 RepID=A0A2P6NDM5_9EUKA|nr:hypothetical protein PROFUN_03756 [Planoprotostelium fungivorum]